MTRHRIEIGRPMRLIGPMFVKNYERGWERGLANLKRMMEAGEL